MSISGSSVHSKIKEQITEVENEHENLSSKIYDYEKRINSLMGEREDSYSKLATLYLPEMDAGSVKNTLKEVQKEVQAIFEEKQNRRKKVEELMKDSNENKKGLEGKFENVTEKLRERGKEHDKVKETVIKECNGNPKYNEIHSQANQAKERSEQNKRRVDEVQKEAKEKLPSYENNRLFSYLIERKYNTDAYIGNTITKKLDAFVAKIIKFDEAKKNYDFLKSMPGLMKEEVDKKQKDLDNLVNYLREMENETGKKYNLQKIIKEGVDLSKERKRIIEEIGKLDQKYNDYMQERKELDNTKGEYHQTAIKKLKEYLKGNDIADLKQKARATPGTEDDKAVSRIEEIDNGIRELKDKSKEIIKERDGVGGKLENLKDLQKKYTSNNYDSDSSYFKSGFDINNLLILYMAGKMSHDDAWNDMKNHQFEEHHSSYSSSSYSSSRSSSHDSDSGFGGGGFSSGGGFGGGGFSSGGGF
jgi:DNA repair exonuclease SbcCD ATPase subunit